MNTLASKLSSRKFWVCIAAFLASFGTGVCGMAFGNDILAGVGAFCTVLSAAIYAAAEAAVDAANAASSITKTETTVSATTTSKETVEKLIPAANPVE